MTVFCQRMENSFKQFYSYKINRYFYNNCCYNEVGSSILIDEKAEGNTYTVRFKMHWNTRCTRIICALHCYSQPNRACSGCPLTIVIKERLVGILVINSFEFMFSYTNIYKRLRPHKYINIILNEWIIILWETYRVLKLLQILQST